VGGRNGAKLQEWFLAEGIVCLWIQVEELGRQMEILEAEALQSVRRKQEAVAAIKQTLGEGTLNAHEQLVLQHPFYFSKVQLLNRSTAAPPPPSPSHPT